MGETAAARPWLWPLVWAARLGVAATFVFAAMPKILDPAGFAADIANYVVFPHWSWNVLAGVVPMVELVGALALVVGWKRRGAAWMLGGLTVAFLVLILVTISSGVNVACGCFGEVVEDSPVGWPLFWRDVALLIGIVISAHRRNGE